MSHRQLALKGPTLHPNAPLQICSPPGPTWSSPQHVAYRWPYSHIRRQHNEPRWHDSERRLGGHRQRVSIQRPHSMHTSQRTARNVEPPQQARELATTRGAQRSHAAEEVLQRHQRLALQQRAACCHVRVEQDTLFHLRHKSSSARSTPRSAPGHRAVHAGCVWAQYQGDGRRAVRTANQIHERIKRRGANLDVLTIDKRSHGIHRSHERWVGEPIRAVTKQRRQSVHSSNTGRARLQAGSHRPQRHAIHNHTHAQP